MQPKIAGTASIALMNVIEAKSMQAKAGAVDPVVLLVDNKGRDLEIAVLIARHLEALGVGCHLEPLEAFRAAVGAHKPSMVVFNHLNASHLASWSRRLKDMNVLVGVLPNEGFVYNRESRAFMSGRFHQPHVDHFFCWNEQHREALIGEGADRTGTVHVVGVPRFDFYFEPWSRLLPAAPARTTAKPRILLCTNFVFAKFIDRMQDAAAIFAGKQQTVSLVKDYKGAVESHWRSRNRILDYLNLLLDDGRFEILLRPHPIEEKQFYEQWLAGLSAERRANLVYEPGGGVAPLILDCDLEISCEACTTAIESWVVRKPTIELIFDRHPMLFKAEPSAANIECDDPAKLPDLIAQHLSPPVTPDKQTLRAKHLETWCATPDGTSALRIARTIANAVLNKKPADWSKLDAADKRRAAKLNFYRSLGVPYHFDVLLSLKSMLRPKRYAAKAGAYRKSITPHDVAVMHERFKAAAEAMEKTQR
jgi:surface carbohydrate biosynthesis protein